MINPNTPVRVAVVDDNPADLALMRRRFAELTEWNFQCSYHTSPAELEDMLREEDIHVVMIDNLLGAVRGVDCISRWSKEYPAAAFILLTGHSSEDSILTAMRAGATDYLDKNGLNAQHIVHSLHQTLNKKRSERQFEVLVDVMSEAVLVLTDRGRVEDFNARSCEMLGYSPESLQQLPILNLIDKAEANNRGFILSVAEAAVRHYSDQYEVICVTQAGEKFPAEISFSSSCVQGEQRFLCVIRNISDRKSIERARDQHASIIDATPDFVAFYEPDGTISYVNPGGRRMMELGFGESLPMDAVAGRGQEFCGGLSESLLHHLQTEDWWSGEMTLTTLQTMSAVSVSVVATAVKDSLGYLQGYTAVLRDITQDMQVRNRLQQMANNDLLTGLANRKMFLDRLEHAVIRSRRARGTLAVLFLDLDHFKGVNDTYGHEAGDELLRTIANRMRKNTRSSDLVARLGGDEFVVLIEDLDSTEDAVLLAKKLITALSTEINLADSAVFVTASIGISTYPDCANEPSELLQAADVAMYQAKFEGRNRFRIYSEQLHQRIVLEETVKNRLNTALQNRAFFMMYQPVMDGKHQLQGMEALVRWNDDGQTVGPSGFIDIAEKSGFIIRLGDWILEDCMRVLSSWQRRNGYTGYLAINVSLQQFRSSGFAERVIELLHHYNIAPGSLEFEITETMLVNDFEEYRVCFERLAAEKVNLVIDDFGTGYASFKHLQMLPISKVKIDKMFIDHVPGNSGSVSTLVSMIDLAQALKLEVVIEGVETREQSEWLLEREEELLYQGYYYYKPLPEWAIANLFDDKLSRKRS